MPYKGENERFSLYVFLPSDNSTTIADLLGKLTPQILDDVFSGVYLKLKPDVVVQIPKFSFQKKSNLIPASGAMITRFSFFI